MDQPVIEAPTHDAVWKAFVDAKYSGRRDTDLLGQILFHLYDDGWVCEPHDFAMWLCENWEQNRETVAEHAKRAGVAAGVRIAAVIYVKAAHKHLVFSERFLAG